MAFRNMEKNQKNNKQEEIYLLLSSCSIRVESGPIDANSKSIKNSAELRDSVSPVVDRCLDCIVFIAGEPDDPA